MISYEKIYLQSHECSMYNGLYELPEFEAFREQMKSYFQKRYGIDYIAINIVNKDRNLVFYRMDNDVWHEAIGKNKWHLNKFPFLVDKVDTINPNEIYLEYFDASVYTYANVRQDQVSSLRAEIFGVRKYGGCEFLITTKENDMILYSITFKDDKSFGELLRNILHELVQDLIRYRDLFTPFFRYREIGGDFTDKKSLTRHLDQFKTDNKSLFQN